MKAAGSYSDDLVNEFRVKRASGPNEPTPYSAGLLELTIEALGLRTPVVTDFGGATGVLARDIVAMFPGTTYRIVENTKLVSLLQSSPSVTFTTQIPEACDIFYSSSAICYVAEPDKVISKAFETARYAVVFVRNSFCATKLFRVQRSSLFSNGSGPVPDGYRNVRISYPHQTISEDSILNQADEFGFRCVARLEEHSGVLPYRGLVYGRQLVFIKR